MNDSISASEDILCEDFNMPVKNGNDGTPKPVAAIMENTFFESYHFGAKFLLSDISRKYASWPPPISFDYAAV